MIQLDVDCNRRSTTSARNSFLLVFLFDRIFPSLARHVEELGLKINGLKAVIFAYRKKKPKSGGEVDGSERNKDKGFSE